MKNKQSIIVCFLTVINGFYPLLCLISYLFGYSVYTAFSHIYSLWLAVIFLYANHFIRKSEEEQVLKFERICAAFLPLITAVNFTVYVFKYESLSIALIMGVCLVFAAVIAEKILNSTKAKMFSVVTSGFLCFVSIIFSLLIVFSSCFSEKTLESHILSPNRTYYADVINVDQGALGGNTVVYVHRSRGVNLFLVSFLKNPQEIYVGEWGESETMQIEWKNENTLIIDGKEYVITI